MPKFKVVDPNNVMVDGSNAGDIVSVFANHARTQGHQEDLLDGLRDWHQAIQDQHQAEHKARGEKHAEVIAKLEDEHAQALAQAEDEKARTLDAVKAHAAAADAQQKAHAEWQAQQEAEKAKRQADHEAALQDLAQQHARTVESLHADLEIVREAHKQLREAVAELGDTPAVLEMARQAERERLTARLAVLDGAAPDGAARAMAAPSFAGLYRATDGRLAKVIRQLPGVVLYWAIDDPATANDPIGKIMERMAVSRWREAGYAPYDGGQS